VIAIMLHRHQKLPNWKEETVTPPSDQKT